MTTVKLQPVRRAASLSTESKKDGSVFMTLVSYVSKNLRDEAEQHLLLILLWSRVRCLQLFFCEGSCRVRRDVGIDSRAGLVVLLRV